jgi:hypothetical protein
MRVNELTKPQLEAVVKEIIGIMYGDGPDTLWSADTLPEIADVLQNAGLCLTLPPKDAD